MRFETITQQSTTHPIVVIRIDYTPPTGCTAARVRELHSGHYVTISSDIRNPQRSPRSLLGQLDLKRIKTEIPGPMTVAHVLYVRKRGALDGRWPSVDGPTQRATTCPRLAHKTERPQSEPSRPHLRARIRELHLAVHNIYRWPRALNRIDYTAGRTSSRTTRRYLRSPGAAQQQHKNGVGGASVRNSAVIVLGLGVGVESIGRCVFFSSYLYILYINISTVG